MNLITLNFEVSQIEKEFRESKQKLFSTILVYQKWIFGLINFLSFVSCLISKNWIIASISLGTLILILISIKVHKKYPYVYEIAIIVYILLINAYIALEYQFASIDWQYTEIFFISFTFASLLNLMNFIKRALLLLITVTFHIIFGIRHQDINADTYIRYLLYVILYVQFMYQFERLLRIIYLDYQKCQQFLNKISKFKDVQSYSVKYDERKSLILIEKNNNKRILKQDQEEFLKMITNMQLSMQNQKSRVAQIISVDNLFSPKKQSLKQLLVYYTQQSNTDINDTPSKIREDIQIYGFYQQKVFALSIFRSIDVQPITVLLMKESKSESQEEELRLRMRNNQKQLNYIQQIFDRQIKKSLIYFRWIKNFANKQTDGYLINKSLKMINYSLIRGYTDFLNLETFSLSKMLCPGIKQFDLILLIKDVFAFYDGYNKQKPESMSYIQQYEIINNLSSNCILSDFKYIKLLLFNLIHYTSEKSQTIKVILDEVTTEFSQTPIIRIKIHYQAPNLTKAQLHSLPILNPQSLEELKHNSTVPLDLDLAVSLILIRRLGPFDRMKLVQQKRKCNYLEFYIFQQLMEDYLLIPIKSMKPSDKIIVQEYSKIANSFSTSIQIESVRESFQFL
ncbi:unnamed protein product [Paramecium primaurelia]|uniref:Transmembrane protein n=1 Tax=Paramecium primaurelia TaxID=5886 RepID=A0A8S1NYB3_PARPR|nr:unnamed protein product [Paramecium primaurelia]